MLMQMNESQIKTINDIERFLLGAASTSMSLKEDKQDVYNWIKRTLVRFRYLWLGKKDKGLVLRYIEHLTGYTRQNLGKLVMRYRKTGPFVINDGVSAKALQRNTRVDIQRLAALDQVVDDVPAPQSKPSVSECEGQAFIT